MGSGGDVGGCTNQTHSMCHCSEEKNIVLLNTVVSLVQQVLVWAGKI